MINSKSNHPSIMQIDVLSHSEHARRLKTEAGLQRITHKEASAFWTQARRLLITQLSAHWRFDSTECGNGDFFVGEDWSGNHVLHVVVVQWPVLSVDFLKRCRQFLSPPYNDFVITVVKSMPDIEDMFELVITSQQAYISFFQEEEKVARDAITSKSHYSAIKALIF